MKFHRNTASAIMFAAALSLTACSAGGEKTDVTQRAPKETEAGMGELISELKGEEAKEPMKGDNQALVEIGTAQELEQFRDRVNEGEAALDAVLTADIDLSSVCGADAGNWVPFEEYNGVFDGGGHEISGLYIEAEEGDGALFQTIGYTGIVKDLGIAGARIQVPGTAAALAIRNEGIVENCYSRDGQLKGHEAMGLLRESAEESSVSGCYVTGSVEGKDRAAGIVGFTYSAELSGCRNEAGIITTEQSGCAAGIAGSVQNSRVENCSNSGTVDGAWDTGGVIGGASEQSMITGCCNTAAVTGKGRTAGIAAMLGQSVIDRCYNTGSVSGVNAVAGILAMTKGSTPQTKCVVANCFNRGEISADQLCAGISLGGNCVIVNNYSRGSVLSGNNGIYGAAGLSDRGGIMSGDEVETFLYNSYSACTLSEKAGGLSYSDTMTEMDSVFYQSDTAVGYYFNRRDGVQDKSFAVSEEQLTGREILDQLNAYVDGHPALPEGCAEGAEEVVLDKWKAGNDGYPVFEWE
ncbi:hypothetical protein DW757_02175 [Clostridium sp. AM29-11AC]|uniref:GLUG motif-containing protein n=1 Tax=Clostridium sp. AM29-11AC TaxID=2293028 RepID=UPI000E547192|nr:GLUG motif-containing protein [Clostridium sp. AM29-11AC]RHT59010.1 hypothetical protein DW757_02175 [Clostridium sp. AM29-11AC]